MPGSGTLRHSSVSKTSSVSTFRVPPSISSTASWRRASDAAGGAAGELPVSVVAERLALVDGADLGAWCSGMKAAAG